MTESKADTSRKRILDAATEIAIEQGPKVLTLDNVAKRCGMSKGGVMHHFKNKDALLAGMVESMIGMMKTELCEVEKAHTDALPVTNLLRTRQRAHEKLAVHRHTRLLLNPSPCSTRTAESVLQAPGPAAYRGSYRHPREFAGRRPSTDRCTARPTAPQ